MSVDSTLSWLWYELNFGKMHVVCTYCEVCWKHKGTFQSLCNFSCVWMMLDQPVMQQYSVNQRTSELYKASKTLKKILCESKWPVTSVGGSLVSLDSEKKAQMKHTFDVCHLIVIESSPVPKYSVYMHPPNFGA